MARTKTHDKCWHCGQEILAARIRLRDGIDYCYQCAQIAVRQHVNREAAERRRIAEVSS